MCLDLECEMTPHYAKGLRCSRHPGYDVTSEHGGLVSDNAVITTRLTRQSLASFSLDKQDVAQIKLNPLGGSSHGLSGGLPEYSPLPLFTATCM